MNANQLEVLFVRKIYFYSQNLNLKFLKWIAYSEKLLLYVNLAYDIFVCMNEFFIFLIPITYSETVYNFILINQLDSVLYLSYLEQLLYTCFFKSYFKILCFWNACEIDLSWVRIIVFTSKTLYSILII